MTRLKAFPYFGGKLSHLNFILDHLPYTERYIEPFGGSAAVLLNREPSPVETYNDLDGDAVNYFRVLREQPDELVRRLERTPYSREEFEKARDPPEDVDDVERARMFFVRLSQGYASHPNPAGWAYDTGKSGRGMGARVSGTKSYHERIDDVADRLSRVQFENRDAIDVIEAHDHEDALIYADPPYPPETRRRNKNEYIHEMDVGDHQELAEVLNSCEAKVALSTYASPLLSDLYAGWNVITGDERNLVSASQHSDAADSEVLFTNYDPEDNSTVKAVGDVGVVQNRLTEFGDQEI